LECASLTIGEHQGQFEETALPECLHLARNSTFPGLQVQATLGSSRGLCDKAEGVVTSPLLPVESELSAYGTSRTQAMRKVPRKESFLPLFLEAVLAEGHDFRYRLMKSGGDVVGARW
jgi:hypothetical protein